MPGLPDEGASKGESCADIPRQAWHIPARVSLCPPSAPPVPRTQCPLSAPDTLSCRCLRPPTPPHTLPFPGEAPQVQTSIFWFLTPKGSDAIYQEPSKGEKRKVVCSRQHRLPETLDPPIHVPHPAGYHLITSQLRPGSCLIGHWRPCSPAHVCIPLFYRPGV